MSSYTTTGGVKLPCSKTQMTDVLLECSWVRETICGKALWICLVVETVSTEILHEMTLPCRFFTVGNSCLVQMAFLPAVNEPTGQQNWNNRPFDGFTFTEDESHSAPHITENLNNRRETSRRQTRTKDRVNFEQHVH